MSLWKKKETKKEEKDLIKVKCSECKREYMEYSDVKNSCCKVCEQINNNLHKIYCLDNNLFSLFNKDTIILRSAFDNNYIDELTYQRLLFNIDNKITKSLQKIYNTTYKKYIKFEE